jgi:hypothetical protein
VHDINLARKLFNSARDYCVVQSKGPHAANEPVWDAKSSACKRRAHGHGWCDSARHRTRTRNHVSAGSSEAVNLMPGGVADARGTKLMREAVQHPDVFF